MSRRTTYERFMAKVDRSGGPDSCHTWMASRNNKGYGEFYDGARVGKAHRWILGHLRGTPLTPAEMACHHCDNPPCVNPEHLYVGDAKSNARDKVERGNAWNPLAEKRKAQTHCKRGHEFTPENTHTRRNGTRQCRPCWRMHAAKQRQKRRAAA